MFAMSYPATQVAGQALGLANAKSPIKQLDIGTGSGVWGIGLAQQSPQISVTAQDWPRVLEVTRHMAARFGSPTASNTCPATSRKSISEPATIWSPSAISCTAKGSSAAAGS